MLNLDHALFSIACASDASLLKVGTGRSWIQKGYLLLGAGSAKDWRAPTPGAATLLSARTVLQMALGAAFTRLGFHPQSGCRIATAFTVFSSDDRTPGELYGGNAFTALSAYPGLDEGVVTCVDGKTPYQTIFFPPGFGRQSSAAVVFVDFIHKQVMERLQEQEG